MALIDALLTQMQRGGASKAVLRGDAPIEFSGSQTPGVTEGAVIPSVRVEELLREIIPNSASDVLESGGLAQFEYSSPLGVCNIQARRVGGVVEFQITPHFPAASLSAGNSGSYAPVNDSGQPEAVLPPELRGFNWGGLLLSWIWAAGNNAWIGLLALVPCLGLIMRIVIGFKGNEWAWRGKRWDSVDQFRHAQKNWTIAGLILVVGGNLILVPIYASIMFPVFARARENARRSVCQQNLKMVSLGAIQYYTDHGKFPSGTTMASWQQDLKPYVPDSKFYVCPSASAEESYFVNPKVAGVNPDKLTDPASTPLFFDAVSKRHLDGVNVAFCDGHIKYFREEAFNAEILPQMTN